jgi:hypothetical protein
MSEPITPITSPAIREPHYERVGLANLGAGGGVLAITSMAEAVSVAQLMAKSGIAIRKHLRNEPGACLGVLMQAMRWEFDPYMVANKSYAVNDQLAYEAQLIAAVVLTRAAVVDEPDYEYAGADATRTCTVTFKMRSGKMLAYTTPEIGKIKVQNSPLWKSDPDQQLGYFAVRSWARRHQPHVLLGVYTVEEAHEIIDVTPGTSGVAARLPGAQAGNGFNREGVEAEGERAAPRAGRGGRKPKAPETEPEEAIHAEDEDKPAPRVMPIAQDETEALREPEKLSPEAVREEAIEAAELVGLIEPQAEPEEPVPTDEPEDDDAEGLAEISEHQDALDAAMDRVDAAAGLPEELQTLINATDTVETWQAVKDAFATFQGTDLWKSLRPEQQNHIRRSTWETLSDREISWLPDRRTDISAFRLWLETVDEWEAVEGGFTTLQGDPGYQAKSDALKGQIGDAVKARIAALKGGA